MVMPKLEDLEDWEANANLLSMPDDMLGGCSVEVSNETRFLYDIFARYRSVVDRDVTPDSHASLVERALSNPALLHGALLLSATRWTWYSGSMETIQKSFLHHKLEAIQIVNDRLQDPMDMGSDTTITSIAALAMAESALGRQEVADAHLNGLSRVLAMRGPAPIGRNPLLQNMILSTNQGLYHMSMKELGETIESIEGCYNTLTLFVDPVIAESTNNPALSNKTVGEVMTSRVYSEQTEWTAPPAEAKSRARFMTCCFRLWTMRGPGSSDMFSLNWFMEALIDECCMTEHAMLRRKFPRNAWLWAAMMTRCAATSVQPNSASEAQQIEEWKNIACSKIRLVSEAANLRTWEEARAIMRSWVWRDNLVDERQLKEMWEGAVLGKRTFEDGTVSPAFLDKRLFIPADELKPVILHHDLL
ncbi:hypothetical protein JX265_004617 [Neoarthrinium moseri]|uniref:Uncharacterized protein n=1 Tax=Neoarthrinium moseri TaxID=1658444 RepID=A0A9P9WQ08_9PEZI|nr:hypothetical protein JX265_004617 [Neoarthrinium moseri]